MTAQPTPAEERWQTLTTILIAIVSTAIALVAANVAAASGNASGAQHNATLAKINLERVDAASRVEAARNERAFRLYQFDRDLLNRTQTDIGVAEADGQSPQGTRLRQEAASLRESSDLALGFTHQGYLLKDADGQYATFDADTFLADRRQTAAIYQDINPDDNFAEAAAASQNALAMNASVIALFGAIMFLSWAQITRSGLRWVWLTAGLLTAAGVAGAYLLAWLGSLLG